MVSEQSFTSVFCSVFEFKKMMSHCFYLIRLIYCLFESLFVAPSQGGAPQFGGGPALGLGGGGGGGGGGGRGLMNMSR